jgi:hypothetical protein
MRKQEFKNRPRVSTVYGQSFIGIAIIVHVAHKVLNKLHACTRHGSGCKIAYNASKLPKFKD